MTQKTDAGPVNGPKQRNSGQAHDEKIPDESRGRLGEDKPARRDNDGKHRGIFREAQRNADGGHCRAS